MFNNRKRKTVFRPIRARDLVRWETLREAAGLGKQTSLPLNDEKKKSREH